MTTPAKQMLRFAERIKKMSREEFLESLRRAGIIDAKNKLTPQYKQKP